jgi:hypothetical protein
MILIISRFNLPGAGQAKKTRLGSPLNGGLIMDDFWEYFAKMS